MFEVNREAIQSRLLVEILFMRNFPCRHLDLLNGYSTVPTAAKYHLPLKVSGYLDSWYVYIAHHTLKTSSIIGCERIISFKNFSSQNLPHF